MHRFAARPVRTKCYAKSIPIVYGRRPVAEKLQIFRSQAWRVRRSPQSTPLVKAQSTEKPGGYTACLAHFVLFFFWIFSPFI